MEDSVYKSKKTALLKVSSPSEKYTIVQKKSVHENKRLRESATRLSTGTSSYNSNMPKWKLLLVLRLMAVKFRTHHSTFYEHLHSSVHQNLLWW